MGPTRYLPAPCFAPLLLMWLGTGDAQKVALIASLWKLLSDWWLKFGLIKGEHPIEAGVEKSVLARVVELSK